MIWYLAGCLSKIRKITRIKFIYQKYPRHIKRGYFWYIIGIETAPLKSRSFSINLTETDNLCIHARLHHTW
jgi:hypothetical protein